MKRRVRAVARSPSSSPPLARRRLPQGRRRRPDRGLRPRRGHGGPASPPRSPAPSRAWPSTRATTVAAGQELARIDTTDTRLALDAARAERAQAEAELRLRLAGSRVEDVREARGPGRARGGRPRRRAEGPRPHGGPARRRLRHDEGARRRAHAARRGRGPRLDAARERLRRLEAGFRAARRSTRRGRGCDAADARIAQLEQQLKDARDREPGRRRRHREARRAGRARRARHRASWS